MLGETHSPKVRQKKKKKTVKGDLGLQSEEEAEWRWSSQGPA